MAAGKSEIRMGFYLGLGLIGAGLLWALLTGAIFMLRSPDG
jgi:hypothetical protein